MLAVSDENIRQILQSFEYFTEWKSNANRTEAQKKESQRRLTYKLLACTDSTSVPPLCSVSHTCICILFCSPFLFSAPSNMNMTDKGHDLGDMRDPHAQQHQKSCKIFGLCPHYVHASEHFSSSSLDDALHLCTDKSSA